MFYIVTFDGGDLTGRKAEQFGSPSRLRAVAGSRYALDRIAIKIRGEPWRDTSPLLANGSPVHGLAVLLLNAANIVKFRSYCRIGERLPYVQRRRVPRAEQTRIESGQQRIAHLAVRAWLRIVGIGDLVWLVLVHTGIGVEIVSFRIVGKCHPVGKVGWIVEIQILISTRQRGDDPRRDTPG